MAGAQVSDLSIVEPELEPVIRQIYAERSEARQAATSS
jgi:hypothetical protein